MPTDPGATSTYTCFNLAGALEFLGDVQGVRDLLPVLCATLSRDVPDLVGLLAQGNVPEASVRLHSLKGFVPVFCVAALAEELLRVERLSHRGASDALTVAFGALAPSLQRLGIEAAHYASQSASAP